MKSPNEHDVIIEEQQKARDSQKKYDFWHLVTLIAICYLFWYFSPH